MFLSSLRFSQHLDICFFVSIFTKATIFPNPFCTALEGLAEELLENYAEFVPDVSFHVRC